MATQIPDEMRQLFIIAKPYTQEPLKVSGDSNCCAIFLREGRKLILINEQGSFTAQLVKSDGERHDMCDLGTNPGAHLVLLGYLHDEIMF